MKRRVIIKLCVFLLLGAVVNVAVAWWCWWLHQIPLVQPAPRATLAELPPTGPFVTESSPQWSWVVESRFHETASGPLRMMDEQTSIGYALQRIAATPLELWEGPNLIVVQIGWPMTSFEGAVLTHPNWPQYRYGVEHGEYGAYPTRPSLPGAIVNTLVFGLLLWIVFTTIVSGVRAVRAWIRFRRRLCIACAYPVGASDVCTECGAQISKTIRTRGRGSMGLPPPATPASDSEPRT